MVKTYTQEQLDIALLRQRTDGFNQTLIEIKQEIKSQSHMLMSLILGIYGIITATALAKLGGLL